MRIILITLQTLCSLYALAYARPQYNYGNGISGTFGGSVGHNAGIGGGLSGLSGISGLRGGFSSGGAFGGSNSNLQSSTISAPFGSAQSFGSGSSFSLGGVGTSSFGSGSISGLTSTAGSPFGSGSIGGGYHSNSASNYNQQQATGQFEAPFVHKQFISVAAPEDNENLERTKHLVIGRPQKNYRVVFIKAPSSSNANVKLSAEYAPQEEKTVIYVLSKKDSSLEVSDIATPAPTVPSKPEVFFIKYKTEEEAQHAQKQIQGNVFFFFISNKYTRKLPKKKKNFSYF